MAGDAITLADAREPTLTVVCEPCGRYNVERLIAAHGPDMRLPELLTILANCQKVIATHLRTSASERRRHPCADMLKKHRQVVDGRKAQGQTQTKGWLERRNLAHPSAPLATKSAAWLSPSV